MRSWVIDLLKFLGAQCIVIHHLMAHGPMSDVLEHEYPNLVDALFNYLRLAVPMFLVVAGFLAAQSLSRARGTPITELLVKRYLRLAPLYLFCLLVCIAVVHALGAVVNEDWIPEPVTWSQVLAHALMLQGVLHEPSISAGVWYVAIDFQLFALVALLACVCRDAGSVSIKLSANFMWAVAAVCVSSLWWFNRIEALDDWAIYFMGAYGLGLLAHFATQFKNTRPLFYAVWLLGATSLCVSWRSRLVVTLISTALLFLFADHGGNALSRSLKRGLSLLGNAAYATFLSHFALVIVFSAIWNMAHLHGLLWAVLMVLMCWFTALAWGLALHRWVESSLNRATYSLASWWSRWIRWGAASQASEAG